MALNRKVLHPVSKHSRVYIDGNLALNVKAVAEGRDGCILAALTDEQTHILFGDVRVDNDTAEQLVMEERRRQVFDEGFTSAHDDEHVEGDLGLVAALFASPMRLYRYAGGPGSPNYVDPWPSAWDPETWDTRPRDMNHHLAVASQTDFTVRIGQLTKAGALILAEIDRLIRWKRQREAREGDPSSWLSHTRRGG